MKLLVACLNVNGLGGSELYHYELCRELHLIPDIDVTLFTLRPIDYDDQVRKKLTELNIKQIDSTHTDYNNYDLIVASQPAVNTYMLSKYGNTPIISIIHSEIRSADPIINDRIVHYITIRKSITNHLKYNYRISNDKISLIYNPIDTSRYNKNDIIKFPKTTGIYIGNINDPLRYCSIEYMVNQCIEMNWNLIIMSNYFDPHMFTHPNIRVVEQRWDNEHLVKQTHFTAGILLGRTTLEGLQCGVPAFIFEVDQFGSILKITSDYPDNIIELSDSKNVVKKHIELYRKFL